MKYDLEERCAKIGENVIIFCKSIKGSEITKPLINQFIRSATSIGANYMEANQASSKKDFINKIRICQKEANESKHWARMISVADENIGPCGRDRKVIHRTRSARAEAWQRPRGIRPILAPRLGNE